LLGQSDSDYILACKYIASQIENENLTSKAVLTIIKNACRRFKLSTLPRNENIMQFLPPQSHYRKILMVKPAKTASGVAIIAVMPKPFTCPHGKCIYCPGGVEYNTPLSYIGTEPST